jgi:Arm DNA-binding domain
VPELPATDQGIRSLRLDRDHLARQGLPADATQIEYRDPKTSGLSLIVGRRVKTWSLTYATPTGRRRATLGRYPAVSLADARREAEAKRVAARTGVDHPAAEAGLQSGPHSGGGGAGVPRKGRSPARDL